MRAIDFCPETHARKVAGSAWSFGSNGELIGWITVRGLRWHKIRCRSCGYLSSALPAAVVEASRLPVVEVIDQSQQIELCSYAECERPGTDYHHFAPLNVFGNDGHHWPVMPLCKEHHRIWHQRMNGYRWNARSTA